MFKNWAEVRIKDDRVESKGAVHVYDERTSPKRKPDYYPTAEQARQIEPEIRQDLIEDCVKRTLESVQRAAKEGRNISYINYVDYPDKYPSWLIDAERQQVEQSLRALGYDVYRSYAGSMKVEW